MGRGSPGAAHSANESVLIADLEQGARMVALALRRWLTPASSLTSRKASARL